MPPTRTHYCNTDFDLSLRPGPLSLRPGLARQVRELSLLGILGASAEDAVLVRSSVPPTFLDHLHHYGLPVPRILEDAALDRDSRFSPLGWNQDAATRNRAHHNPASHPSLETIRLVNSRVFLHALEAAAMERSESTLLRTPGDLEAWRDSVDPSGEWMAKREFGNAGLANRRWSNPDLTPPRRRFLEDSFSRGECVVMEPWRNRVRDLSTVFQVPLREDAIRTHQTLTTRDGATLGALFEPGDITENAIRGPLLQAVRVCATALAEAGYVGPVCLDSFSWRDGDRERWRWLVDLNARHALTDGVYRLWQTLAPQHTLLFRFFNRAKLVLPDTLPDLMRSLEGDAYHAESRLGALPVSPPNGSHPGAPAPGKLAMLFLGADRPAVQDAEQRFRKRFEGAV